MSFNENIFKTKALEKISLCSLVFIVPAIAFAERDRIMAGLQTPDPIDNLVEGIKFIYYSFVFVMLVFLILIAIFPRFRYFVNEILMAFFGRDR